MKSLIFAALFLLVTALSAGNDEVIFRQSTAGDLDVVRILQDLVDFTGELFPAEQGRHGQLIMVLGNDRISGTAPGDVILHLDPAAIRRGELDELAKAVKALLIQRNKCRPETGVPLWFCAAFRHRSYAAVRQERFFTNHRVFPGIEAMLQKNHLPEWKKVLSSAPAKESPAENSWFDEYSRLITILLRRAGFRGNAEDIAGTLEKIFAGKNEKAVFRELIWNKWNPMPCSVYKRQIDEVLRADVPLFDQEGKSTGKKENVAAALLPEKTADNPERKQIFDALSEKITKELNHLPNPVRSALRRVAVTAAAAGKDPDRNSEFLDALRKAGEIMVEMQAREKVLDQFSGTPDRFIKVWRDAMEENSGTGLILTPESERFLLESEKNYIR